MRTTISKISAITGVVILLSMMLVSTSCKKDKICHGKVTVLDTGGVAIAGATVKLSAPSVNGDVVYTGTTDGSGIASFDVKLPAIFDIYATKATYPGKAGVGVIRLDEPGKKTEVKVTMK